MKNKRFTFSIAILTSFIMLSNIVGCSDKSSKESLSADAERLRTQISEQTEITTLTKQDSESTSKEITPDDLKYSEGLEFESLGNGTAIVKYKGSCLDSIVNIPPKTPDGETIVEIASEAFQYSEMTTVILPDTITTIGNMAFCGCYSLVSIDIPNSVTEIGSSAFFSCYSLTSIKIPDSITTINERTFHDCKSLSTVEIPNSVTTIGRDAFMNCTSLNSIVIPESVNIIENSAFRSSALESIEIPGSVKKIEGYTFDYCIYLTHVKISDGVEFIDKNAFSNCGRLREITIPNSVTSISSEAFASCKSLETVTIPEGVVSSKDWDVFTGCKKITSINGIAPKDYFENWQY